MEEPAEQFVLVFYPNKFFSNLNSCPVGEVFELYEIRIYLRTSDLNQFLA